MKVGQAVPHGRARKGSITKERRDRSQMPRGESVAQSSEARRTSGDVVDRVVGDKQLGEELVIKVVTHTDGKTMRRSNCLPVG